MIWYINSIFYKKNIDLVVFSTADTFIIIVIYIALIWLTLVCEINTFWFRQKVYLFFPFSCVLDGEILPHLKIKSNLMIICEKIVSTSFYKIYHLFWTLNCILHYTGDTFFNIRKQKILILNVRIIRTCSASEYFEIDFSVPG